VLESPVPVYCTPYGIPPGLSGSHSWYLHFLERSSAKSRRRSQGNSPRERNLNCTWPIPQGRAILWSYCAFFTDCSPSRRASALVLAWSELWRLRVALSEYTSKLSKLYDRGLDWIQKHKHVLSHGRSPALQPRLLYRLLIRLVYMPSSPCCKEVFIIVRINPLLHQFKQVHDASSY